MKSSYLEICRLLASSGYRERDIADFIYEVSQRHPNEVINEIDELRHFMRSSSWMNRFDKPKESSKFSLESDTATKIERLLIHDAGFSKSHAVELLLHELESRYPNILFLHESKKGFYSWIQRLISIIPEKDLLYAATTIRNRSVHDLPIDWRLK